MPVCSLLVRRLLWWGILASCLGVACSERPGTADGAGGCGTGCVDESDCPPLRCLDASGGRLTTGDGGASESGGTTSGGAFGAGGANLGSGGAGGSGGSGTGSLGSGGSGGSGSSDGGVGASSGGSGGRPRPAGSGLEVDGRVLLLDGEPFRLRGINWNPVPKGGTHPADLDYRAFAASDIPLMKRAGINVIRTYERLEDVAVLDQLHEAGIYVLSTVYGWWQDDPEVVVDRVSAVKDHPAILAWVLGNEWNYNQLYSNGQLTNDDTRDLINQAAALIKSTDTEHLVATIYGELGGLDALVGQMPDIDLWGINSYRGISHGDLFSTYANLSDKPMFLGEYGADAYNASIDAVDLQSQAEATRSLTQEIIDNYATPSGGTTSGGFVFEFADEWWKDAAGSADVQDVGGIAPGGGPHPDQTFNEEFWGLVDIDRNPRPAFQELENLYAPGSGG